MNCFDADLHIRLMEAYDVFLDQTIQRDRNDDGIPPCQHRMIDSFTPNECYEIFRFKQWQLRELFQLLGSDDNVKVAGRWYRGEKLFLVSLVYTSNARVTYRQITKNYFDGDYKTMMFAFRYFCKHRRDCFGFLNG